MNFHDTIRAAVLDIATHGYDSQARIDQWVQRIEAAARASLTPPDVLEKALRTTLAGVYARMVEGGGLLKTHKGVERFTIDRVKPQLRAELNRRMLVSANLIKLNRQAMINKTVQRFAGWASSVPPGGSEAVDKRETTGEIRKALGQLPFEERRVLTDQGHKLIGDINNIVAVAGGAIAAQWRSHWRQAGYNYREDHKERDGHTYAIRGNWAIEKGLMRKGPDGYTDEITKPGEEVYCRCAYQYLYNLRDLPSDMVTAAGRATINR